MSHSSFFISQAHCVYQISNWLSFLDRRQPPLVKSQLQNKIRNTTMYWVQFQSNFKVVSSSMKEFANPRILYD